MSVATIRRTSGVGRGRAGARGIRSMSVGRDPEAARPAEDVAVLLARPADGRRVDDRQELLEVLDQHPVEQRLVAVLERGQPDVALEVVLLAPDVLELQRRPAPRSRRDAAGKQAVEAEGLPLGFGEPGALVEQRPLQEVGSAERDSLRPAGGPGDLDGEPAACLTQRSHPRGSLAGPGQIARVIRPDEEGPSGGGPPRPSGRPRPTMKRYRRRMRTGRDHGGRSERPHRTHQREPDHHRQPHRQESTRSRSSTVPIRASDLRQIKVDDDDFGLHVLRPGLHEHRLLPQRRSPSSTATRASFATAATRSRSSPSSATFLEAAYLLLYGELPTAAQLEDWTDEITHHTFIHENIKKFIDGFHHDAHPMGMLVSTVGGALHVLSGREGHPRPAVRRRKQICG